MRGYIFTAVCLCVRLCVCVCMSTVSCEQNSSHTDLDAVFAKLLLTALAQTLLKLVTLSQRSRSRQQYEFPFGIDIMQFSTFSFYFQVRSIFLSFHPGSSKGVLST